MLRGHPQARQRRAQTAAGAAGGLGRCLQRENDPGADAGILPPDARCDGAARGVFDKLDLSARAYDKVLRVARTVADLDGSDEIEENHIACAVNYRSLDRKFWRVGF